MVCGRASTGCTTRYLLNRTLALRLLQRDPLNSLMNLPALLSRIGNKGLVVSENGYLRWYIASMSVGAVVVLALMLVI